MSSHDDELAMVKRLDTLRARMEASGDPDDCRAYWDLLYEVEARLKVTAVSPRERPASGQRDARDAALQERRAS